MPLPYKPIVLLSLVAVLQGCAAPHAALVWAFDRPDEPRSCRLWPVAVSGRLPEDAVGQATLRLQGGWLPAGTAAEFDFSYETLKSGLAFWKPGHASVQQLPPGIPCQITAPLLLDVSFSSGQHYRFEVPADQLPKEPVFGYFSLSVEKDQLILALSENKGATRVTLHAGKVWALEPSRRLAVLSLAP